MLYKSAKIQEYLPPVTLPTANITHYYTLNNTLADSVGSQNLTGYGYAWQTLGKIGTCFNADSDSYLSAPQGTVTSNGDSTISCWLYTTSLAARQTFIQSGLYTSWGSWNIEIAGTINVYWTPVGTSTYTNFSTPSGSITINTWYHIVVVRNFSEGYNRIYIDGVQRANAVHSEASAYPPVGVFYAADGYAGNLLGRFDELSVWNVALSPEQVELLYTEQNNGVNILA